MFSRRAALRPRLQSQKVKSKFKSKHKHKQKLFKTYIRRYALRRAPLGTPTPSRRVRLGDPTTVQL